MSFQRKIQRAAARGPSTGIFTSGKFKQYGPEGYAFGLEQGWRGYGPAIYGEFLTYGKDAWVFQRSIAERVGCGIRCVQWWLRRWRDEGLVQCWRSKKGEKPPGVDHPFWHGWSHRVFTALHAARSLFEAKCAELAAKRAERGLKRKPRRYTVEEIDAALAATPVGQFAPPRVPDD
ncbi:MAG TPA: hypothetical protein VNO55_31630 [Polyangia bacterium]|nr:hypothetical protein [Polyangia bacterium]